MSNSKTKTAQPWWKLSWHSWCYRPSSPASPALTKLSGAASGPSSSTATKASSGFARPSRFFQLGFLCLIASAWMAAAPDEAPSDERISSLLARGWQPIDSLPCEGLKAGSFYELIAEESSQDFFVLNQSAALAPKPSWPEPPRACHPIPSPNFVEEL